MSVLWSCRAGGSSLSPLEQPYGNVPFAMLTPAPTNTVTRGERAQNQPLTSPWHQASASCTGGQAATSPPSAGGVFESSPVIALHLLYWQLRSTPNAPQHSVHGGGLLLLKMETSSALIRKKVFANVEHLPLLNYLSFSSKDNSQRNSWLDWKQNY